MYAEIREKAVSGDFTMVAIDEEKTCKNFRVNKKRLSQKGSPFLKCLKL
jgi:ribosomal protein S4E